MMFIIQFYDINFFRRNDHNYEFARQTVILVLRKICEFICTVRSYQNVQFYSSTFFLICMEYLYILATTLVYGNE